MTTTLGETPANKSAGKSSIFRSGMVTTTTSPLRAACSAVTAVAPVSAANPASDAGPREFAITTSWPTSRKRRARVPPILPAPIMPIFISNLRPLGLCAAERSFRTPHRLSTSDDPRSQLSKNEPVKWKDEIPVDQSEQSARLEERRLRESRLPVTEPIRNELQPRSTGKLHLGP